MFPAVSAVSPLSSLLFPESLGESNPPKLAANAKGSNAGTTRTGDRDMDDKFEDNEE